MSAFKKAVLRFLRLTDQLSSNLAMRSAGSAAPFDFNTIDGTGSLAYIAAARSNSAQALIVRPALRSKPSSFP